MRGSVPTRDDEAVSTHPPVTTPASRTASPRQLAWLGDELGHWAREGLVGDDQVAAILARYRTTRGFSLAALVLTLGAAFVGIGLIWLVAANLDAFPPLARLAIVAAFWIATTLVAEWLAGRREHGGAIPSPVVGAVRLLAALSFGAVVFQAAQWLQVPSGEPRLVGVWALGALVYAYVVTALMPLLLGVGLAAFWFLWQVVDSAPSPVDGALALLAGGLVAVALGVLHERRLPAFAAPWREIGAGLLLVGLFVAAIPQLRADEDFTWNRPLAVGLVVAALATATALAVGRGSERWEPVAALAMAGLGALLAFWEPGTRDGALTTGDWAHAGVAVAGYVLAAAGVAAAGVLRDSWRLTAVATIALVVFTTFQSFAVFARIIEGAWLFVVLGLIFLATGFAADRARRELARSLEDESDRTAGAES